MSCAANPHRSCGSSSPAARPWPARYCCSPAPHGCSAARRSSSAVDLARNGAAKTKTKTKTKTPTKRRRKNVFVFVFGMGQARARPSACHFACKVLGGGVLARCARADCGSSSFVIVGLPAPLSLREAHNDELDDLPHEKLIA